MYGKEIRLAGSWQIDGISSDTTFTLLEYADGEEASASFTGTIKKQGLEQVIWQGVWASLSDTSVHYPFILHEFNRYTQVHKSLDNGFTGTDHRFRLYTGLSDDTYASLNNYCYAINVAYLQIDLPDKKLANVVNKQLRNLGNAAVCVEYFKAKEDFRTVCNDSIKEQNLSKHYELNYQIKLLTEDVLCVQYYLSEYLGGIHRHEKSMYQTIDLHTGKSIFLNDLFVGNSDYLSVLSNYCNRDLNERQADTSSIDKDLPIDIELARINTAPELSNFSNFYLSNNALVIHFSYDALGRQWAARTDELVAIPFEKLFAYLKDDGLVKQYLYGK